MIENVTAIEREREREVQVGSKSHFQNFLKWSAAKLERIGPIKNFLRGATLANNTNDDHNDHNNNIDNDGNNDENSDDDDIVGIAPKPFQL